MKLVVKFCGVATISQIFCQVVLTSVTM